MVILWLLIGILGGIVALFFLVGIYELIVETRQEAFFLDHHWRHFEDLNHDNKGNERNNHRA